MLDDKIDHAFLRFSELKNCMYSPVWSIPNDVKWFCIAEIIESSDGTISLMDGVVNVS